MDRAHGMAAANCDVPLLDRICINCVNGRWVQEDFVVIVGEQEGACCVDMMKRLGTGLAGAFFCEHITNELLSAFKTCLILSPTTPTCLSIYICNNYM